MKNVIIIVLIALVLIYIYNSGTNKKKNTNEINSKDDIDSSNNNIESELENQKLSIDKIKNEMNSSSINEQQNYIDDLKTIPKYNLNKNLDENYINSIKSVEKFTELQYEEFTRYEDNQDLSNDFIVLDFKLTGQNSIEDEIIQIGAIKFNSLEPIEIFETYVKPTKIIPTRVSQKTGITNETVNKSQDIEDVIPKLIDFLGNYRILIYDANSKIPFLLNNLYEFNFKKLNNKFTNLSKFFEDKIFEYSSSQDREKKLENYDLTNLKDKFNLNDLDTRSAISVCEICAYIYIKIVKQNGDSYCIY